MNGKAHALAGAIMPAPLLLVDGTPVLAVAGLSMIAAAGALAPDLDHAKGSLAINRLGFVGKGLSKILRALSKQARKFSTPDDRYWFDHGHDPDHRGLTHTILFGIVASLLVAWGASALGVWTNWWAPAVAFFAGWISHLAMDAMTVEGCPLLWPIAINWKTPHAGRRQRSRWYRVHLFGGRLHSCEPSDWWVAWTWVALLAGPTIYFW